MACDRIGIFQLKGIVILILTHSLIPLPLGCYMGIVLIDTLIKHVGLLVCKRSALRLQCIENHLCHNLLIVVIREGYACLGKMKSVSFLELRDLLQLGYVSVRYVVHALDPLEELIAVLHDHQLVVTDKAFLLELHCRADPKIVFDRPLV